MRISLAKSEALVKDPNWIMFADNHAGSVWWNIVTGAILWMTDDGWCNLTKPKIQPQR
jgi:hypothetical protein